MAPLRLPGRLLPGPGLDGTGSRDPSSDSQISGLAAKLTGVAPESPIGTGGIRDKAIDQQRSLIHW